MSAIPHIQKHFTASAAVRDIVIGMAVFGYIKGTFTGAKSLRSAIQTAAIDGLAAAAAFTIARAIGSLR